MSLEEDKYYARANGWWLRRWWFVAVGGGTEVCLGRCGATTFSHGEVAREAATAITGRGSRLRNELGIVHRKREYSTPRIKVLISSNNTFMEPSTLASLHAQK